MAKRAGSPGIGEKLDGSPLEKEIAKRGRAESEDYPRFFVPKRIPALGWTVNRAHPESGRFVRSVLITYALVFGAIAALITAAMWLSR